MNLINSYPGASMNICKYDKSTRMHREYIPVTVMSSTMNGD